MHEVTSIRASLGSIVICVAAVPTLHINLPGLCSSRALKVSQAHGESGAKYERSLVEPANTCKGVSLTILCLGSIQHTGKKAKIHLHLLLPKLLALVRIGK